MIIKCPECGHQVSSLAETCPSCGIAIAGNITKCPHCGGTMLGNQDVCPNCLESVHQKPAAVMSGLLETPQDTAEPSPEPQEQQQEKPRKHKALWATLLVSFVIALGIVLVGYYFYLHTQQQNELYAYENAVHSSEPAVLQNFLDIYPAAPKSHRDSVQAHLDGFRKIEQEWHTAAESNQREQLQKFVERHPGSMYDKEAKLKIDSLDWVAALGKNTVAAYQAYMQAHADGFYYDDARAGYMRLEEQKADSLAALRADSLAAAAAQPTGQQ